MLINQLEEILISNLKDKKPEKIELSDDDCLYRKFYFDYLSDDAAYHALQLFPNGDSLYRKYKEILESIEKPHLISDSELCNLVQAYLQSSLAVVDEDECEDAIDFIKGADGVFVAEATEVFVPGQNVLHKAVYGSISDFLVDELPDEDALWLLYDWSLEKTKWATVSAYFLSDFLDVGEDTFKLGFQLWQSRNSNHYWAEGNSLKSSKVFCKSFK